MVARLGFLVREMVGIANSLTCSLQTPIQYAAVALTTTNGPVAYNNEGEPSWASPVPMTAVVEEKQELKRKVDGTQQLSKFKITIMVPGFQVNTLDRFLFADNTPFPPILATQATLDENGNPYSQTVWF